MARVLVVDDDVMLREMLRQVLIGLDHEVFAAASLQDVQERINQLERLQPGVDFDVVITDWDLGPMSQGDGRDVCALVRSIAPSTKICLWSAGERPHQGELVDLQTTKLRLNEILDWEVLQ